MNIKQFLHKWVKLIRISIRAEFQIQALSFSLDGDDEESEDVNTYESVKNEEKSTEQDEYSVPKKKIKKNPDVDTSFLPDREREEEETKLREELRQVSNIIYYFTIVLFHN